MAKAVIGRDSGTKERRRLGGIHPSRNSGQGLFGRDHKLGIASIPRDPRYPAPGAQDEVPGTAGGTGEAVASVPANSDPLSLPELLNSIPDFIDIPNYLVARDPGIGDSGEGSFPHEHVAVANSTGQHPDPDFACPGMRFGKFRDGKRLTFGLDLDGFHHWGLL
jgi:hypothetical protein